MPDHLLIYKELHSKAQQSQAEAEEAKAEAEEAKAEAKLAKAQANEKDRILTEIQNSTTWKSTKPVRSAIDTLRKVFKRKR